MPDITVTVSDAALKGMAVEAERQSSRLDKGAKPLTAENILQQGVDRISRRYEQEVVQSNRETLMAKLKAAPADLIAQIEAVKLPEPTKPERPERPDRPNRLNRPGRP